ncbi:hypothetical protein DB88DRAFT_513923 [Papiliotrema laurentii]|nr:hypothetical protein DB88DRAFT_513923 [Papiliotrema laurentii]
MPRMLDPEGWNLGAKTAFFWLGTNLICTTYCFFQLPETGDFSFADLDILFANRVLTRQFENLQIIVRNSTAEDSGMVKEKSETLLVENVDAGKYIPRENTSYRIRE